MASEKDFVQKLIAQSKKLTEANVKKCQNEIIFKELTLFQNLSNFCKDKNREEHRSALEKVLRVCVKVYPSPLRLDPFRCNETMTVIVENVSKSFSFSSNHWQFVLNFNNGQEVSSWSLEDNLEPGKSESFSTSFFTNSDISPVEVRLRLLFSISHLEYTFVKTLELYKTSIDVLHLLTPTRYPRTQMSDSSGTFDPVLPFTLVNPTTNAKTVVKPRGSHMEDGEEDEEIPTITQFFFKLCPNLLKSFVKRILLQDSKSRWLSTKSETDISDIVSVSSFTVFYLEEEILVSIKSASGTVAFKSSNPKLLCALKVAVLERFMTLENIKVVCPNDVTCEKLYAIKLRLEEMSKPDQVRQVQVRDFVNLYLDLRDVSETIEFSCGPINDCEVVVIE